MNDDRISRKAHLLALASDAEREPVVKEPDQQLRGQDQHRSRSGASQARVKLNLSASQLVERALFALDRELKAIEPAE